MVTVIAFRLRPKVSGVLLTLSVWMTKPVDFRKGAESLATLVRETMQADPFDGAICVFHAKRADRIKLVFWDGTGTCACSPSGHLEKPV